MPSRRVVARRALENDELSAVAATRALSAAARDLAATDAATRDKFVFGLLDGVKWATFVKGFNVCVAVVAARPRARVVAVSRAVVRSFCCCCHCRSAPPEWRKSPNREYGGLLPDRQIFAATTPLARSLDGRAAARRGATLSIHSFGCGGASVWWLMAVALVVRFGGGGGGARRAAGTAGRGRASS